MTRAYDYQVHSAYFCLFSGMIIDKFHNINNGIEVFKHSIASHWYTVTGFLYQTVTKMEVEKLKPSKTY